MDNYVALCYSKDEVLLQCLEIWLLPRVNSLVVSCTLGLVLGEPCKCLDHRGVPITDTVTVEYLQSALEYALKLTSFGKRWSLFIRFFRSRFFGSIPFTAFHKTYT